jgi:hypothetical protein
MWVFLAATVGVCAFVVTWAIGLNADVSGLIALGFLGLGILGQMASRPPEGEGGQRPRPR